MIFVVESQIDISEYISLEPDEHYIITLDTSTYDKLYVGCEISEGETITYYLMKESHLASYSGGFASNYFYQKNVSTTFSEVIDLEIEERYYLVIYNPQPLSRVFTIYIVAGKYPATGIEITPFVSTYLPIIIGIILFLALVNLYLRRRDKRIERKTIQFYKEKWEKGEKTQYVLQTKEEKRAIAEKIKQLQLVERRAIEIKKKPKIEELKKEILETEKTIAEDKIPIEEAQLHDEIQVVPKFLPASTVRRATRAYKIIMILGFVIAIVIAVVVSLSILENQLEYWFTVSIGIVGGAITMFFRYRKYKKKVWKSVYSEMMQQND
jgi:uncharacterized membrane protein